MPTGMLRSSVPLFPQQYQNPSDFGILKDSGEWQKKALSHQGSATDLRGVRAALGIWCHPLFLMEDSIRAGELKNYVLPFGRGRGCGHGKARRDRDGT